MNWPSLIAAIGALAGFGATTWAIVSDRSPMRVLERLADLDAKLPPGGSSQESVRELQDRISSDVLRRYKNPTYLLQAVAGAVFVVAGVAGILLGLEGLRADGLPRWLVWPWPADSAWPINHSWSAWILVTGYFMALLGYSLLMVAFVLGLRVRRKTEDEEAFEQQKAERKQRDAEEDEWFRRQIELLWWRPWARWKMQRHHRLVVDQRERRPLLAAERAKSPTLQAVSVLGRQVARQLIFRSNWPFGA